VADAIAGRIRLYGSFVSLTEVEYITLQEEGQDAARQRMADLGRCHSAGCTRTRRCAARRRGSRRPTGSRSPYAFVAATALRFDATLVHKDPEFRALADIAKQRMLPAKVNPPAP